MFKTSIIGCGAIAQVHAAAVSDTDGLTLISAADIKPERARALTAKYGGKAYDSIDALLAGEKPDVLHICTPHYTHTPLAVKALRSGVNVLLEKPCGIAVGDIATLEKAERESGKKLAICFQNRYKETSRRAKQLIESGELGKILGARGFVTWKRDEQYYTESGWRGKWATEGGGVMINQAIHTLDLMIWLVGNPLTVDGKISNHHLKGIIEVEDTAEACFDFGGGVRGIFFATTSNCFDSPVYLQIECENGSLELEGDSLTVCGRDGNVTESFTNKPTVLNGKACWGGSHRTLIEDFYDSIAKGREFPVGPSEGGRSLKALLRIYESARAGSAVDY